MDTARSTTATHLRGSKFMNSWSKNDRIPDPPRETPTRQRAPQLSQTSRATPQTRPHHHRLGQSCRPPQNHAQRNVFQQREKDQQMSEMISTDFAFRYRLRYAAD